MAINTNDKKKKPTKTEKISKKMASPDISLNKFSRLNDKLKKEKASEKKATSSKVSEMSVSEMKSASAKNPMNKNYNKFKKNPTDKTGPSRVGDKTITFGTQNAGKTYTKTTYENVNQKKYDRVTKKNPNAAWGDDRIRTQKTISGNKALRQANRLGKRIENKI